MGRKGSGVEVRGNSIRVQFTYNGEVLRRTLNLEGKPLPPTAANLKYAHRLAAEIRERIRFGSFSLAEYFPADGDVGQPLTVGTQLDDWLAAQRLEVSTNAGYSSAIRFWKGAVCDRRGAKLGDRPVRMLKHSDVLTALASRPDLTGKTVNNYVSVLRKAMELAVADKTISTNPVSAVARAKHQKPLPDPFSRGEAESIVADMAAHYPAPIANYVEFKFFTGLRTSESFGLHWRDVDLAGKHLLVHRAIVRGVEKLNTKTNTARQVILNSRALSAIQRQRKHTQIRDEHVFLDPRYDEPWFEERAFRRSYWEPTLRRLGLRYRPPYNTRHTYATMMLMAGITPAFCAKQLGHSVEMLFRTHARRSRWLMGSEHHRPPATDGCAAVLSMIQWSKSSCRDRPRGPTLPDSVPTLLRGTRSCRLTLAHADTDAQRSRGLPQDASRGGAQSRQARRAPGLQTGASMGVHRRRPCRLPA